MSTTSQPFDRSACTEMRGPAAAEVEVLAGWILGSGDVPLIADGADWSFSATVVHRWIAEAIHSRIVVSKGRPVAFASLSSLEASLPSGSAEVCHFIVEPGCRRRFVGSRLLLELTALARAGGLNRLFGRVVPANGIAIAFLESLRWVPVNSQHAHGASLHPGFEWFTRQLRDGSQDQTT